MDNGMEGMLDTYLLETESLLDKLDEMLIADEKEGDFSSDDVNEIFRIMHTVKGSSAMMEFNSLSTIAHHIEDLFFYIRDRGIDSLSAEHKKDLFNLMFQSEDFLRSGVDKVKAGEPLDDDIGPFAKDINDFLAKISGNGPAGGNEEREADSGADATGENDGLVPASDSLEDINLPKDDKAVRFLHVYLEEGVGMENLRAFMIVNAVREYDIDFRVYPSDMDSNPDTAQIIIDEGFFLAFDSEEAAEKGQNALKDQPHVLSYQMINAPEKGVKKVAAAITEAPEGGASSAASAMSSEARSTETSSQQLSKAAEANAGNANVQQKAASQQKAAAPKTAAPVKQSLISVNLQKLDSLNALVGEIVITESMVTSSPVLKMLPQDAMDNFTKSARQLRKLTDDLQDISMSLRMVSISGVFQKMNRIVRDMKQKLNKDVKLTIIGENTEVDKTIVDSIQDPIMHMVRNSMDHGIEETAEERIAAGKNPQGELILSASHTSSEVIISITDDGYGMDPEKILDKAEEKGILVKPRSEYSKKEALGLIMLPGFSTNQQVTEYSGRGVGMDVVKKNLESVGGTISVSSELGEGSTFTMKIPLTLAIMDGMKVMVGDTIFTIPIANILSSFKIDDAEVILDESGREMVNRMDTFYPIVHLKDFYHINGLYDDLRDGVLIWVEAGDRSCCLFVDDLIGEQQVVVKPLPQYFNIYNLKDYGINGCSILGDGNICIILDVLGLYNQAIENA